MTRILGRRDACARNRMQALTTLWVILAVAVLAACSPELNWRELSVADGSLRVAFPGKLQSETRPMKVAGYELPFTMSATQAGGAVFAVGYMDLPPETLQDRELAAEIIKAVGYSLARNLQGEPVTRGQVEVRYAHDPGRTPLTAEEFEVHGNPAGEPMWLLGRVLVVGNRLIEVAALGPESALSREAARTFLNSMRVQ